MTEMSAAFKNIVRVSAFLGLTLLLVVFLYSKQAPRTVSTPSRLSGSVAPGIDRKGDATGYAARHTQEGAEIDYLQNDNDQVVAGPGETQNRDAAVKQEQPSPSNGGDGYLPRESITPMPDLVELNLDDGSLPIYKKKSAQPDESELQAKHFLLPGKVAGIIHYVWCGERWFGFKQYLALQSAIKAIRPDKVVFHYEYEPQGDRVHYHQWYNNLIHDYPFLYLRPIDPSELDVCHGEEQDRIQRLLLWLDYDGGGIYISENTWVLNFQPQMLLADFEYAVPSGTMDGYIILRGGLLHQHNRSVQSLLSNKRLKTKRSECSTLKHLNMHTLTADAACIHIPGHTHFDFLTPMQIWDLDAPFGRLARKLFYGTEKIVKPKPSYDELVPNIGHMIWIGGGKMDFLFYLALLSKLFVLKVDVVYLHGDTPPTGKYWEQLKQNKRIFDRIKFITRTPPYKIYQGDVEWYYRALMSDLIRVDIMIQYGGIYTDTDAIWTKPLSYEERGYEAVASFDWVDWSYPFPDSVNFGLSYGKRNAPFWRIFRDSMRTLHNDVHGFTGVMMPYKLLEKYPQLLRIDSHLMAICYQQKCHPTYVENYHNETNNHVTTNSIPNWREDLHALHWTHPNPPEYANETTLLAAKGMFAEVGKFVLRSAGLLE